MSFGCFTIEQFIQRIFLVVFECCDSHMDGEKPKANCLYGLMSEEEMSKKRKEADEIEERQKVAVEAKVS